MIFNLQTEGNTDIVDITGKIREIIRKEGINNGIVNIFVRGSTASVTTIEADKNLYNDLREILNKIIPMQKEWKHHQTWGGKNGGSHLRASIFGPSINIPVEGGELMTGTWQQIVLIDFDTSPRTREIIVTFLKSV